MRRLSALAAGWADLMIGKVCKRGSDVRRLLGYLFREGLAGEHGLTASHAAPRLIAAWDGTDGLEPPRATGGGRDLRLLAAALNAPLLAAGLQREDWKAARPVYHLAIAAADEDPQLSDEQWTAIATEYVDRIGLAPRDDEEAVRWVAVRHADNHVHVVATLARQDGKRVWPRNDFYRSREASRAVEERYGLRQTSPADRTGPREITRAEQRRYAADQHRACQAGRSPVAGPDRDVLRRRVRVAAAGANDLPAFLERLRADGVLVRERFSQQVPEQITGYAVALSGEGQPVWFGGGEARPRLEPAQAAGPVDGGAATPRPVCASARARGARRGADVVRTAARPQARGGGSPEAGDHVRAAAGDPTAAADTAWAAADLLAATARLIDDGQAAGPVSCAADLFERAARERHRRTPPSSPAGHRLRGTTTALLAARRLLPTEARQTLALLAQLQSLATAVGRLRETQGLAAQAAAARAAAEELATVPIAEGQVPATPASSVRLLAYGAPAATHRPTHRPGGTMLR